MTPDEVLQKILEINARPEFQTLTAMEDEFGTLIRELAADEYKRGYDDGYQLASENSGWSST